MPADITENFAGNNMINDGLVAEWSVRKIEEFKESEEVIIDFRYYPYGHLKGYPIGKYCESYLSNDEHIAIKIIEILTK